MRKEELPQLARLISEKVEKKREEIVDFCRQLIKIPSVAGEEKGIQEFVAAYLRKMGLAVKMWDPKIAKMKGHPAYIDTGTDYEGRPNVVGIHKGKGQGRSLILNGHTDVVTPEPLKRWSHDPWGAEVSEGKIYGRGACDMKGGVAGMIKALETLRELDLAPLGDVIVEVVVDEEAGGNGTLASILEGYNADGAIFAEPTSCKIEPAHRGASFWRVSVEGKGAHAGVMHKGISAVEKAILIYGAIQNLKETRNEKTQGHPLYRDYPLPVPLLVGKFNSGEWPSAVPEECILEGAIEFLPGEELKTVRKEFERAIEQAAQKDSWLKKHPPEVEWFGLHFPAVEIPLAHPLIKTFQRAYSEISGEEAQIAGLPAGCDMRLRVLYGKTPSIIFGPGDISLAHRVDEFIRIDELVFFTKILALGILKWSKK